MKPATIRSLLRPGAMILVLALALVVVASLAGGQETRQPAEIEWRHYSANLASTKYSPADQIDATNVANLEIAWRWTTPDGDIDTKAPFGQLKGTPLMADGQVYSISSLNQVSALDPATGKEVWSYDPKAYELGVPTHGGFTQRGLELWSETDEERLMLVTGTHQLVSLDPKTGRSDPDFGEDGMVHMGADVGTKQQLRSTGLNSPSIVCAGTVIMGMTINDFGLTVEMPKGHVRGYDAATGEKKWVFHTIAEDQEVGSETWHDESWRQAGNTNVWSMMSCDEELGWVYLPIATPTSDYYGGHRPGDNLFAESLVALDARTGERQWHFQAVHHGLWDYDFPCAPNLVDLEIDGKTVKAVAQVSKQGFTYVFDRVTGEPIWPIEERPVPPGEGPPGEWISPTQPFPTKPPPFDRQGVTEDDLIDLTPALAREAREIFAELVGGPLFTPAIEAGAGGKKGLVQLPGQAGGANWGGAAVDPETGMLYVPSQTRLGTMSVVEPSGRQRSDRRFLPQFLQVEGPRGLPLVKPPWARVTAIDLNRGEIAWQRPLGQGPRNHPALVGVDLPELGAWPIAGLSPGWPMLTKTLLFVVQSVPLDGSTERGAPATGFLYAFDKQTGDLLATHQLPKVAGGNPMTYVHQGRQYVVVPVGARGEPHELIAYALPSPPAESSASSSL